MSLHNCGNTCLVLLLFAVQELGNFSNFASLVGKFMASCYRVPNRPLFVVLAPLVIDPIVHVGYRQKAQCIQTASI